MSTTIENKRSRYRLATIGLLVVASLAVGYLLGRSRHAGKPVALQSAKPAVEESKPKWWTCSMHPQIRQPKEGLCPICNMDLIPLKEDAGDKDAGLRRFATSESARKLMDIQTTEVVRKFVSAEIRMVGKVDYDETRVGHIAAWVPGRLDRLYVDYTGVPVRKGDHLVYLYSPELLSGQEELLQALKAVKDLKDSKIASIRESAAATVEAAREKLRLWGLTQKQVEHIEKTGAPSDHITIYAPMGGIVIHKNAQEGMYVQTGTRIYTIADLNQVWVRLDAYESDLMWLRYGQQVEFRAVSYPGEVFKGQISFIDPYLDTATRTVKVRVNVPNSAGKLKPGMFVRASVRARVAAGGRVMDPELAGKWICPMHPDVVKDVLGKCDLCKMPLVRAESLGYVAVAEAESSKPLVIPVTAALVTGERAVVYVELPGKDRPTFEGREIVLGPRAGDSYIVRHGLKEGERVVTQGNFKIDSALQIQAKPSMMTPAGGGADSLHEHHAAMGSGSKEPATAEQHAAVPEHFISQLEELQKVYLKVGEATRDGSLKESRSAFKTFGDSLKSTEAVGLDDRAAAAWKESAMLLGNDAILGGDAEDAEMLSRHFADLEKHWSALARRFQIPPPKPKPKTDPEAAKKTHRFREQLGNFYAAYLGIQKALAGDDAAGARSAVAKAQQALQRVDMELLSGKNHAAWMRHQAALGGALKQMAEADGIQGVREGFALLSEDLSQALPAFGFRGLSAYLLRCPMAFNNRGAVWLQTDKDVRNPYFGSRMLKCGTVLRPIARDRRHSKGDRRHE